MAAADDILELANLMEGYAQHLKSALPPVQQAILDALVLAQDTKQNRYPPKILVARLRGAALGNTQKSIVLSSYMDVLANKIEQQRTHTP